MKTLKKLLVVVLVIAVAMAAVLFFFGKIGTATVVAMVVVPAVVLASLYLVEWAEARAREGEARPRPREERHSAEEADDDHEELTFASVSDADANLLKVRRTVKKQIEEGRKVAAARQRFLDEVNEADRYFSQFFDPDDSDEGGDTDGAPMGMGGHLY